MARNEVSRLKITIDIDQATGKILRFNQTLGDTQRKVQQTGQSMSQMQAQTQAAGNTAAASAVNFQTMSQGLLNLSTSAVQTFTSISNLDRAQNRAKQSVIAVARAQDLLANKEQRAAEMRERGITSGQKYENILREIETATADLTVKQEKQKIEQDAVNDIYMLFYANIANVGFSTMQTVVAMLGQEKAARLGAVVATKLHTFATWDNIRAARLSATNAKAVAVFWGGAASGGLSLATIKTKLLTHAMTGLKFALGPIGLAMIGITAIWVAYDHAVGGVTAEVEDFSTELENARTGVDDMTESMAALTEETKKGTRNDALPYMIAMQNAFMRETKGANKELADQVELLDNLANKVNIRKDFSTPSAITAEGTQSSGSGSWSLLPQAFAQEPIVSGNQPISNLAEKVESISTPSGYVVDHAPITATPPHIAEQLANRGFKFPTTQIDGISKSNTQAMAKHFNESKTKMESRINELDQKVQKGQELSPAELNELQVLNLQYATTYKGKSLDLYTGQIVSTSGIPQDQQLKEWSKDLSFKYKGVGNFREAAGYTIPEKEKKEKENLWVTMYERGGDQRDLVLNMMSGLSRNQRESFDYGTNRGFGLALAGLSEEEIKRTLGGSMYLSGVGKTTFPGSEEGIKLLGLRTRAEQQPQLLGSAFEKAQARAEEIRLQEWIRNYDMETEHDIEGITGKGGSSTWQVKDGKVESTPNVRARQAMAAAQAMGRITWGKEQARNKTVMSAGENVRYWVERAVGAQNLTTEDNAAIKALQDGHNNTVREMGERAFETGRSENGLGQRLATQAAAKALGASIALRIQAEKAMALQFGNQLGISQNEALSILRDKSQGEQTLNDMLAYQQRLDAMSNGVVS